MKFHSFGKKKVTISVDTFKFSHKTMKEPFEEQKRPKAEEEESLNGLNGGFLDLI